ncbi:hypothetical protein BDN72DRAFT_841521 [Pluteus cervinus]|uniref:Uncharacterized protein n=1 Tax=Pluteus cervinus TaxID=181527 RepID=A0ACD3AST8_9AGAR|nr:hypothetical protein BDN72DRAFT_841521 [Pluteus cervinus]
MAFSNSSRPVSDATPLPNIAYLIEGDSVNKIDAEIARLTRQIRSLRQLRNSVVAISRFPVEILAKVFLHCHWLDHKFRDPDSRLIVSWVCHHWRDVALHDPVLWTFVRPKSSQPESPSYIQYIQQCFIRSRNLPLVVIYDNAPSEVMTVCSSQLHRIRKLRIGYHFTQNGHDPLPYSWQQPAPLLSELELIKIGLEGNLFGGTNPPLQSLFLASCIDCWDSPIISLSTLTTLKIHHPEDSITPEALIAKLQALPALKFCSLYNCFEYAPTPFKHSIRLPCLENLVVAHFCIPTVGEFLRCLDISDVSLAVIYEASEVPQEDFEDSFEWFQAYHRDFRKDIHSLSFRQQRGRQGTYAMDSIAISTASSTSNRPFTFEVNTIDTGFDFDPVICASGYLPLGNVRDMSLDSVSFEGLKSFGPLPRLESLKLDNAEVDCIAVNIPFLRFSGLLPSITKLTVESRFFFGFENTYPGGERGGLRMLDS